MSPDLNIPSQFNSNDFMNFFTDKIDNIRNTITNVDSTASSTSASFIAPKEKLQCFITIGQDELNKLITASKPTTCLCWNHISNVTKTAFFHLRNIAKLRNMLSVSDAEKLVHAFMTSRLDYCNALLGGCPASSINKLQIVQNAAARVLTRSRKYDHITPILQSLHWLPIKFRISY